MNKSGVISSIAQKANISKKEAQKALDSTIGIISEALVLNKKVALMGFGNFSVHNRKKRDGRNPQTGETVEIKAKKIPKFYAGKLFIEKLNEEK